MTTTYRVLSWRGIASRAEVTDETGASVKRRLPACYQREIDRVAMAEGLIDADAYLEAWASRRPRCCRR